MLPLASRDYFYHSALTSLVLEEPALNFSFSNLGGQMTEGATNLICPEEPDLVKGLTVLPTCALAWNACAHAC